MDKPLRIIHLEDTANDALLLELAFEEAGITAALEVVHTRAALESAMERAPIDAVVSDGRLPGFSGEAALELVHQRHPGLPFVFLSGHYRDEAAIARLQSAGADACFLKSDLRLVPAFLRQRLSAGVPRPPWQLLTTAVQELSLARSLPAIQAIVRRAARALTGADGATFVLRDGDLCHYADEDAIEPLWKGKRFPMAACISGWAMLNREAAVIEDIYDDPRIPTSAYRPTFVKSLAMVPIRTLAPVGAIGNYWATKHRATPEEVELLRALADSTSVALENIRLYGELEERVRDRTAELRIALAELEAFSAAVSHDLRAPLRSITGFARALSGSPATASPEARDHLGRIEGATAQMSRMIDDLLALSEVTNRRLRKQQVDLAALAREALELARSGEAARTLEFVCPPELVVSADEGLMRIVMQNLVSNAWKYSSRRPAARIELGRAERDAGDAVYTVSDNGAGFDASGASDLFAPFRRFHAASDFPGTGVGLATVKRIISRHGGTIWAESAPDRGAKFHFTLG